MKEFKKERIAYFKINTKYTPKIESDKNLSKQKDITNNKSTSIEEKCHKNFLNRKKFLFRVDKFDSPFLNQTKGLKEGSWTLKEHIQYLQGIEKFGVNWVKIFDLIPSRTSKQIRSHSQKFYKRLKKCKDTELGIDLTSKNIKNVKDMIAHIKSVNKDFNIVTVFLYLSEKCYPKKNHKKEEKLDIININNILCEDIDININSNDSDSNFNKDVKEKITDREININNQIINNNFNNIPFNNVYINNINYFNGVNNANYMDQLALVYLNNSISLNNINNNIIFKIS